MSSPDNTPPIDPLPTPQSESETSDYVEHIPGWDGRRLIKQGLFHYCGHFAGVLSSLVLVPLMLHRLGAEAYGLWIVALALPGMASGVDNGLYLAIVRETGLHRSAGRILDGPTAEFLTACCGGYVTFGILGGVLLVLCESGIVRGLHLSPAVLKAAPATFLAVALGFAAGRIVVFGNAVLSGMQRFARINAISVGTLLLRFTGFTILLGLHHALKSIAGWYAGVSVLEAFVVMAMVRRAGALSGPRALFHWRLLRRSREFAFSSLLTSLLQNLCWFSPPILLGILSGGTSATISLYAGQRPCYMISDLTWRGAEVVFSAAAEENAKASTAEPRPLMVVGTKYLLAVALPLCVGLLILAPALIQTWLRDQHSDTVSVMRWTSLGVIADAVWAGPLHVLWARGFAKRVLWITAGVTASILILNVALIPRFGTPGSAIAFAASTWGGAIVTCRIAAREIRCSLKEFLFESFSDALLPSLMLGILVLTLAKCLPFHPRLLVALSASAGASLYTVLYWKLLGVRNGSKQPMQTWFKRIFKPM